MPVGLVSARDCPLGSFLAPCILFGIHLCSILSSFELNDSIWKTEFFYKNIWISVSWKVRRSSHTGTMFHVGKQWLESGLLRVPMFPIIQKVPHHLPTLVSIVTWTPLLHCYYSYNRIRRKMNLILMYSYLCQNCESERLTKGHILQGGIRAHFFVKEKNIPLYLMCRTERILSVLPGPCRELV